MCCCDKSNISMFPSMQQRVTVGQVLKKKEKTPSPLYATVFKKTKQLRTKRQLVDKLSKKRKETVKGMIFFFFLLFIKNTKNVLRRNGQNGHGENRNEKNKTTKKQTDKN